MRPLFIALSASLLIGSTPLAAPADEPPAFKDTPQEYGLTFVRPYIPGDQARLQARSGTKVFAAASEHDHVMDREKAYMMTGAFPADDAAAAEAAARKKQAIWVANGTKVQLVQTLGFPTDDGFVQFPKVRILSGPSKDRVAVVGMPEVFLVETFPLKAGDEGLLGKGRLNSEDATVAVVGEVSDYNPLMKSSRDGEPRKNQARARNARSVWPQEPGTRVKVVAVACTADRADHYGLAGPAVRVEVLDGAHKGKVGWTFPEAVVRAAEEAVGSPKAQARAGWLGAKSEALGYVIELPGTPTTRQKESADGFEVETIGYKARGVETVLVAMRGPEEIPRGDAGRAALKKARDRAARKLKAGAKITYESSEKVGTLRGLGFGLESADGKGRGMVLADGKTAYSLFAIAARTGDQFSPAELRFLHSFAVPGLATSAKADARLAENWGREVDPDGDVEVRRDGRSLAMTLPGTAHVLAPERGKMNAPRVTSPVEGPFVATVRVGGEFRPARGSTVKGLSSRQAAGLIVWGDEKHYLVFQHRATADDADGRDQIVVEEVEEGRKGASLRQSIGEGPVFLRLECRTRRLVASYSSDGKSWKELKPVEPRWLVGEQQVGIIAISTSPGPHKVTFDDLTIEK